MTGTFYMSIMLHLSSVSIFVCCMYSGDAFIVKKDKQEAVFWIEEHPADH